MSMNEPRSIHAAEDWGVVLQSVPSKHKKEIVRRLEEIFELDKRDAEQVLSNVPLILIDNISFGLATRVKKYFQKLGAVTETTNHDMIKKNCFQIVWPQTPDLSFFLKDESRSAEAPSQGKKEAAKPATVPAAEKKFERPEVKPELPKTPEVPAPVTPETPEVQETHTPVEPVQESPVVAPQTPPVVAEIPTVSTSSSIESDWERRARELNEKLRKIQDEKQQMQEQHVEVSEKVKSDFQQQLEKEKQKSDEIAKAYEDLRTHAEKQEALTKEGEEWRSKALALGEKVRELETDLIQKTSAIEHLIQQKDDLSRQAEKAAELASQVAGFDGERTALQNRVLDFERNISAAQHELGNYRDREQGLSQKAAALEREIQEMKEALTARDAALGQFEKQMLELAEKARGCEALRQEHATIRKDYEVKLVEQEVRLAKLEEEHRRYRSRVDRKSAAATRELGESVRSVDVLRQGLQKLILFLGSESAVLDSEKKSPLKSPLTRGPDAPNSEKS